MSYPIVCHSTNRLIGAYIPFIKAMEIYCNENPSALPQGKEFNDIINEFGFLYSEKLEIKTVREFKYAYQIYKRPIKDS